MTFLDFLKNFPDEESIIDYFIRTRYSEAIHCPHCGSVINHLKRSDKPKVFNCSACKNTFSIFKGTIFEKSSTDLQKWFYAIHLFLNAKKGISALQLKREIGVTYKTAWRMLRLIREAMGNKQNQALFEAVVEIDETYVGGKPRRKNNKDDDQKPPHNKRGRGTSKTPVVGIKERSSKKVHAQVALPNEAGQKLTGKQLFKILDKVCAEKTTVITDEFSGYNFLNRANDKKFIRLAVNHSIGQFSAGNGVHVNGIESFWAVLKRGIYGIYHHVSVKYLQRYVDEFCFRQNHRDEDEAFKVLVRQCIL